MSRITFGKELNKGKGITDVRNKTSDWLIKDVLIK